MVDVVASGASGVWTCAGGSCVRTVSVVFRLVPDDGPATGGSSGSSWLTLARALGASAGEGAEVEEDVGADVAGTGVAVDEVIAALATAASSLAWSFCTLRFSEETFASSDFFPLAKLHASVQ